MCVVMHGATDLRLGEQDTGEMGCDQVLVRVDLAPVIARAFPMAQARGAFERASDRQRAMKVLIDFAQPV